MCYHKYALFLQEIIFHEMSTINSFFNFIFVTNIKYLYSIEDLFRIFYIDRNSLSLLSNSIYPTPAVIR